MPLRDLLQPATHDQTAPAPPTLMVGTILDVDPLRVIVRTLDGGHLARRAFGSLPDATEGDEVRVALDERGELVVVQWEPAGA